jgi:hypothetical protein
MPIRITALTESKSLDLLRQSALFVGREAADGELPPSRLQRGDAAASARRKRVPHGARAIDARAVPRMGLAWLFGVRQQTLVRRATGAHPLRHWSHVEETFVFTTS